MTHSLSLLSLQEIHLLEPRARTSDNRGAGNKGPCGGTVKGNLVNVDPDPEKVKIGMPVRVIYADALGRKDRDGNRYLSYFFEPRDA